MTRPNPTWARIAKAVLAVAIVAYGAMAVIKQEFVGRTRSGTIVESTGMVAVGMGLFFVGGGLLMASLALPNRLFVPALVVGLSSWWVG